MVRGDNKWSMKLEVVRNMKSHLQCFGELRLVEDIFSILTK